jgi:hypothetical protein
MSQTLAEQETIIRWDREDPLVHLWSANPVTWRKLARLGIRPTRETATKDGAPTGKFYTVPLARFRWGLKPEGQRPRRGNPEALQKAREARGRLSPDRESPAQPPAGP